MDDEGNTTEEGFKFDVHEKRSDNQRRYEEIGLIMDKEVYRLLETQGGLDSRGLRLVPRIPSPSSSAAPRSGPRREL